MLLGVFNRSLKCCHIEAVVKWSACSPSTLTIRLRIPVNSTQFFYVNYLKRLKINKKRPGMAAIEKNAINSDIKCFLAVVVAQLVEQLLPTPEVHSSNHVIGKYLH